MITSEIRNAIAHAIRDMQSKKLTWMRGYTDLVKIWDKISRGEIKVSG
jgi:hypothetical protein